MAYPRYMFAIEEAIQEGYFINETLGTITNPSGQILSSALHGTQRYPTVTLITPKLNKHSYSVPIHKVIAYKIWGRDAFTPGLHVRHLNANTLDNRKSNLALGTPSENERDKPASIRQASAKAARAAQGPQALNRKLTQEQAEEIRSLVTYTDTGKVKRGSLTELAQKYNLTRSAIWYIVHNVNYVTR